MKPPASPPAPCPDTRANDQAAGRDPKAASPGAAPSGLVQGGLGGPEDELLESGQEEVFSRTEVETGRIEHSAGSDPLATNSRASEAGHRHSSGTP